MPDSAKYARPVRTFAVLPVKRFGAAKQRLAPELAPSQRRELAAAMVEDVLAALTVVRPLEGIVVVTAEDDVRTLATARGLPLVDDPRGAGQSPAAALGIARAAVLGAERVVLVPGDCPLLSPAELTRLLTEHRDSPGVTIVPDRHGTGTNALVLSPPTAIAPAFGPASRRRHESLARAAGLEAVVAEVPSLGLDVDTADDLHALWALLARRPLRAGRTRGVLERVVAPA
jgi:2-phospho-L-lactate/phosphoenolpyruvate guanylyltransferase